MKHIKFQAHRLPVWALLIITVTAIIFVPSMSRTGSTFSSAMAINKPRTINKTMQNIVSRVFNNAMRQTSAKLGSAILLDANSGAVLALASAGSSIDGTNVATSAWQPGSALKPLLIAAALNERAISPKASYYEPGYRRVDDRLFMNAEFLPPAKRSVQDILTYSLNTGAIYILESLGGGSINDKARNTWYSYLTNRYHFGQAGSGVRAPSGGQNLNLQYASMAFGTDITVPPLQLAAAYAALINGGIYYQPLLQQDEHRPGQRILSQHTSAIMVKLLHQTLVANEPDALRPGYVTGGKTGTAPVIGEDGAFKVYADNGVYVGFIGKAKPGYILLVRFDEPKTTGFASKPARETWAQISNDLIDQNIIQ